jgi:hypothetical protein
MQQCFKARIHHHQWQHYSHYTPWVSWEFFTSIPLIMGATAFQFLAPTLHSVQLLPSGSTLHIFCWATVFHAYSPIRPFKSTNFKKLRTANKTQECMHVQAYHRLVFWKFYHVPYENLTQNSEVPTKFPGHPRAMVYNDLLHCTLYHLDDKRLKQMNNTVFWVVTLCRES